MVSTPTQPAGAQRAPGASFEEMLLDSIRKTPWFLTSIVMHLIVFLVLAQMDFGERRVLDDTVIAIIPQPKIDDILEELPDDEVVEEEVVEEVEKPVLDETVEQTEDEILSEPFDADTEDDPSDAFNGSELLGLGTGGGNPFGARGGGGGDSGPRASNAVHWGLDWLARHQNDDGSWDCDDFGRHCDDMISDGPGFPTHDPGVTGLALLAFLGAGYHQSKPSPYQDNVKRGLRWLRDRQDAEGCFGPRTFENFVYGHAICALAMVEAYGMSGSVMLHASAQKGIDFIHRAKNPYAAWRYGVRSGENDTSVTGWMVMAMKSAKMAKLSVAEKDFFDVRDFLDKVTDDDGRVGYTTRGQLCVRPVGKAEEFPAEYSESMTAAGVLVRIMSGEDPASSDAIKKGAKLLTACPPRWDPPRLDYYYWYYGTLAMHQVGGSQWKSWEASMKKAILKSQIRDESSCKHGSWDPIDAWGEEGGRVYSTALLTMCLEIYYRYPRVFGGR